MKRTLILLLLANICYINIFSQSERILKTVEYTINEENQPDVIGQSLTYTLENGGLRIRGYMLTNCNCIHLMTCFALNGAIFLSRSEVGFLVDCDYWHFVDFMIDGIPEGDYEVYLMEYGCDPESADYALISTNAIPLIKGKDYSLRYDDEKYTIVLSSEETFPDAHVEVFNYTGKKVWERTYTNDTIQIPSFENLSICKITMRDKTYTIKLTQQ